MSNTQPTPHSDSELPSIHANEVKGLDCPACGHPCLMLLNGYITCTLADCPNPDFSDAIQSWADRRADKLVVEAKEEIFKAIEEGRLVMRRFVTKEQLKKEYGTLTATKEEK